MRDGGVIGYPTDSCYAIGCHTGDKAAMERMRRIRQVDDRHHLTLMCRDLSEIAAFARNITNEKNLKGVIENYMAAVFNEPRIIGVSLSGKL